MAFLAEYIDSSLGMGYGTTLTPLLLLMGYEPLQIVPSILLSELITGLLAGFTHHAIGNVDFKPKTMNVKRIYSSLKEIGVLNSIRLGFPQSLKVVIVITLCSVVGTVAAVFIAINLPKFYLKLYIGILIFLIGIVIIATINKEYKFSWKKITILGLIASFNKGISGGGYGPVVVGGQLVSGVSEKNAVAITSLAEGITCIVGVAAYILTKDVIDWLLAPYLIIGAVISVPFSAYTVKIVKSRIMKIIIGIVTIILGLTTIIQIFL
ncbi:MAG: sulfite exporter TauE/SafE family protein [Deltaproteobacteria bacterium]|uniref:Probable membrane transporter protein n=1 Tax=Candidatus Zymogenus saltonus TaxID=2844893 RepID=A0A9D8KEW5_9DELT|nr:sulfite exporter TauE/SafE family protein [Candidatus Zymogenus saltonus]